jgi:hypothetical protein
MVPIRYTLESIDGLLSLRQKVFHIRIAKQLA